MLKLVLLHRQRRQLIRRRGQAVEQSRQHLAVRVHLEVDAAQTVDDAALLIRQHQVGPAAHRLQNQAEGTALTQLVRRRDRQRHHTLQRLLLQRLNDAAAQVLTQQHTEHGRLGGVVPQCLRQVQPGLPAAGAQQQTLPAAKRQHDLVAGGLLDFFNTTFNYLGRQLRHDAL